MKLLLGDDDGDLWTVGYLFVGGALILAVLMVLLLALKGS